MKQLLSIAIGIACCSVVEAGLQTRIDLPTPSSQGSNVESSEVYEYVPLAEQVFPETPDSQLLRKSKFQSQVNWLLKRQRQSSKWEERQRKLYERIRQQKLLENAEQKSK
ncbi:hypothetical protein [Planctomycetes bacterium K23_9]|uniref:Uncharacterized protein n=1 Tax=Stieleria marina TaxID=1930275 RepID=A0A517NLR7_9BACT|nr:hypothetical protein K239x_00090 [Planctomycetes bacterium K23_9]